MKHICLFLSILLQLFLLLSCDSDSKAEDNDLQINSDFTVTQQEWIDAFSLRGITSLSLSYNETVSRDGLETAASGIYKYSSGVSHEDVSIGTKQINHFDSKATLVNILNINISAQLYPHFSQALSDAQNYGYELFKFSSVNHGYEYSIKGCNSDETKITVFFGKNNLIKKLSVFQKSGGESSTLVCEIVGYNETVAKALPADQATKDFSSAKLTLAYSVACEGFQEPFIDADAMTVRNSVCNFLLNFLTLDDIRMYSTSQDGPVSFSRISASSKTSYVVAIAGNTINYNKVEIIIENGSITELYLSNISDTITVYNFKFIY